jgi:hypothetical protein
VKPISLSSFCLKKKQMRITFLLLFFTIVANAQPLTLKKNEGGLFSLGARTTISTFNHGEFGNSGFGLGGQFRVQLSDRVNTDWFLDYITSDLDQLAFRTDYHIGWSVLFYPLKPKERQVVKPYILAGHCFDYTVLKENTDHTNQLDRWSSAVQAGIGTHFNITQRMDLSLVTQYMIHLGTHIHAEQLANEVVFTEEKGASLEGHLLIHIGLNYKIGDLW